MEQTRLEKSLRAIAWAAVAATVLTLLAMGSFLIHPSKAGANRSPVATDFETDTHDIDTLDISLEEDRK
jgi:hypothetical protein